MTEDAGRRPIPARNLAITKRIARVLGDRGVTPNMISAFGLAVGVGSGLALGLTQVFPDAARPLWAGAAILVLLRGISNMLDGMVAVEQQRGTPSGLFWNELPDRLSDIALFVGAGYSVGGSPVAGWLGACLALLVTYVRALGVTAGAPADFRGPFAKQQRMFSIAVLAAVLAVAPETWRFAWGPAGAWGPMAVLLWVMVPGIVWTAVRRLRRAVAAVHQAAHH
jgi:phosphatidylglycerophosphate synthase